MKKPEVEYKVPDSKIVEGDRGYKRTKAWVDRKKENENSAAAVRDRWKGNRK